MLRGRRVREPKGLAWMGDIWVCRSKDKCPVGWPECWIKDVEVGVMRMQMDLEVMGVRVPGGRQWGCQGGGKSAQDLARRDANSERSCGGVLVSEQAEDHGGDGPEPRAGALPAAVSGKPITAWPPRAQRDGQSRQVGGGLL